MITRNGYARGEWDRRGRGTAGPTGATVECVEPMIGAVGLLSEHSQPLQSVNTEQVVPLYWPNHDLLSMHKNQAHPESLSWP